MGRLKRLGRYEIVRALGSGAMGVVYEAHDSKLRRRVAIKTISVSAVTDEAHTADHSERFMREARAIACLNHPNIVTVYDFGEEGDVAYFVMEFIKGRELKHYLDSEAPFPLKQSLGYMLELLSALDYAHAQGIVHRDLKPANIMLDDAGRLKLTDFGVATALDATDGAHVPAVVGTPAYMAPEQILGGSIGPRSDIFAAGILCYQLLTWTRPFGGENAHSIQQAIVHEPHALLSTLDAALSPELDGIVGRALAKRPEQRYARAAEFAEDIKRFLASGATEPDSATPAIVAPVGEPGQAVAGAMPAGAGSRCATVMVTGFKGDSAVARGDSVSLTLIKAQSDIVLPAIRENHGVVVKSGDGTLSYFAHTLDAVRAAARIQREMDALNLAQRFGFPALVGIGLHSGECIAEGGEIRGEAVSGAFQIGAAADAGGILLSESAYLALSGNAEIHCRFVKQITLAGAQEPGNAYKAFWNPQEIELDRQGRGVLPRQEYAVPVRSSGMKLVWGILGLLGMVLLLTLSTKYFGPGHAEESRHGANGPAGAPGAWTGR